MLKSSLLSQIDCIDHRFFGRVGGVSRGNFFSLNTSYKVGDVPESVKTNREIISKYFDVPEENLLVLAQIHSAKVLHIHAPTIYEDIKKIEMDALTTALPDMVIGVLTADCVPILLVDTNNKVVAAMHGGWRGLFSNIIENTIAKIKTTTIKEPNFFACIGPCVQQQSYEVDNVFYDNFLKNDANNIVFFQPVPHKSKNFLFNLSQYAHHKLVQSGINPQQIDIINKDTYTEEDNFFSHRRSQKNGDSSRGLQLSCIKLKPNTE